MRRALGDLVKLRRIERGYTQRELANLVGAGFTTTQQWEQGTRAPSIADLIRLARLHDMPLSRYLSPLDDFEVPPRDIAARETRRARRKKPPA